MPSAVNTDNLDVKKVSPAQPVTQRNVPLKEVDTFKALLNRERNPQPNSQARQKSSVKKENDAPSMGSSSGAMPLGMFSTPSISENTWDIAEVSSADPMEAALTAMAKETYMGAAVERSWLVDGSLHVRVCDDAQFDGAEIMVTMAVNQEEKKRIGNQIHMQIWSTNQKQRDAFLRASEQLQGAKFSGCALNVDVKPLR